MKKQAGNKRRFWTGARTALTCAGVAALTLVISNCKSNDTANLSANKAKPQVTITSKQGAPPPGASQLETVPEMVWNSEIQALDGTAFKLSDYNDKVVVLDLWATWCGPCRMEVPHLVDLSNEYKDKGVQVIGLTTESPQADGDKVRDFAKEFNINYRLGFARGDMAQSLMNGNYSIPQTFVIAPGGRIITKFRGFSDRIPDMIRAAVDKANEKTGD